MEGSGSNNKTKGEEMKVIWKKKLAAHSHLGLPLCYSYNFIYYEEKAFLFWKRKKSRIE